MKPASVKTAAVEVEVDAPVAAVMGAVVVDTAEVVEAAVVAEEAVATAAEVEVEAVVAETVEIAVETGTVAEAEAANAGKPQSTFKSGPARFCAGPAFICGVSFHPLTGRPPFPYPANPVYPVKNAFEPLHE
jgi:hypothetical protein